MKYARKCGTIIFDRAWAGLFDALSAAESGMIIKAIFDELSGLDDVQLDDPRLEGVRLTLSTEIEQRCKNYLTRKGAV